MQAAHPCLHARRRVVLAFGAALCGALGRSPLAWAADPGASAPAPSAAPQALETVATFNNDFRLVGIGVTRAGGLFATASASIKRSRYSVVEVDSLSGASVPFPDVDWNTYKPAKSGENQWISAQALWVDERDRLWVLDSSLPGADQRLQPPKLAQFDLDKRALIRSYTFETALTPLTSADSLNDVRIDLVHGYAFISNAGNRGGILVVRLSDGQSRLVLAGDRSCVSDPSQHLTFGGRIALGSNRATFVRQTDGIALSPQRDWLYYRPLTDHHYWRVPTAALIDETLAPEALARQVQYLGDYAITGGLLMGGDGTLYGGDVEHRAVVAFTVTTRAGKPALAQRTLVNEPQRLSWADSFALQNDYLYFADSHLHELDFSNGYPRKGRFTIFRVKVPPQPAGVFPG
jgi:sugar lactone lactonase YvrE